MYGDNLQLKGGFAEYAVAPEEALADKPEELTFAQAAAIPQAAAIALRGTAGVAGGQRVLINGAGGGSGTFAIQLPSGPAAPPPHPVQAATAMGVGQASCSS